LSNGCPNDPNDHTCLRKDSPSDTCHALGYRIGDLEIILKLLLGIIMTASIMAPATPFCFCAMRKHLTIARTRR
jgi:hypothetical protein